MFNYFQVSFILNEMVMGGLVLETNMSEIMTRIEEQNKIEKEEVYYLLVGELIRRLWKTGSAQASIKFGLFDWMEFVDGTFCFHFKQKQMIAAWADPVPHFSHQIYIIMCSLVEGRRLINTKTYS